MKNEQTIKKKFNGRRTILGVVEWSIVIMCVGLVAFIAIFASKKPTPNTSASFFGYETRLVVSGSMDQPNESYYQDKDWSIKRVRAGSLVFIKSTNNISDVKVGDVVTFQYQFDSSQALEVVTHRIISIEPDLSDPDTFWITTHGDNNQEGAVEVITNGNLIGKVVGTSYALGVLYTNVFSNKAVMLVIILTPCLGLIGYEIYKITKIVKEDKDEKKVAGALTKEEEEIYDLEKQLAELKKKKKSKSKSKGGDKK